MERLSHLDVPDSIYQKLMAIEQYLAQSSLEHPLLELIRLRVAQMNRCPYCLDMHYKELKAAGETDLRMYSLNAWRETDYYSEKERVALKLTEALTVLEQDGITDALYDLLTTVFTQTEICDLALAICQINTWTRIVRTFRFTPGLYKVA